jgi:hypothetical protein
MEETTLSIEPPYIHIKCLASEAYKAYRVGWGIQFYKRSQTFRVAFGVETLISIGQVFSNAKVIKGQEHIDRLKSDLAQYGFARESYGQHKNIQLEKTRPFKVNPYYHQLQGLFYMEHFAGAALFADCGCLTGDTKIKISRGGGSREYLLEDAFHRFHNSWDRNIPSKVRSFLGDRIGLHNIVDIKDNGTKEVWELKLENGFTIKATPDHEFLTEVGWCQLQHLVINRDYVMIDTTSKWQKKVNKNPKPRKQSDKRLAVGEFHPYARKQLSHQGRSYSYLVEEHRLILEAAINGISKEELIRLTYDGHHPEIFFIDCHNFDVHHIDEDHFNNEVSNLRLMTKLGHQRLHGNSTYFGHGVPEYSRVVSVETCGFSNTYDLVCADPHRNFVANGIVVHNSGKTAMTLWDIENKYMKREISPSSVLIVGKLMTLKSGWLDDTSFFTDLTALNLWEPSKTKTEKGEIRETIEHGPKPPGKARTFRKTEYYHHDGTVAILSGPRAFDPRKHVATLREWKQVGEVKFGTEKLTEVRRRNLRSENIRRKINGTGHSVHILNHEALIQFTRELTERRYEYVVIDESTAIKNPKSKIFKALIEISKYSKFRRILSGTPSPQGPQDLWSQFYFLDRGLTFGPDYNQFLEQHFDLIQLGSRAAGTFSGFKIALSAVKNTMGYIHNQLENRIFRCRLRDCVDLPPISISQLDVYLTDEQEKHYETMSEALFAELDGRRIEVTIDLARIGKLRQITGGFLLDSAGDVVKVSKTNPKLDALLDFISEIDSEEKIVIFAVFRCEIQLLLETLGGAAVAIYGGETDVKKIQAQEKFKTDPNTRFIICQPQSAAYGVNGLTVSRYLLFYSIDFRADCNYQAIKRIERTGQQRNMVVKYLIAENTIDQVIFKALYKKDQIQQDTINQEVLNMGIHYAQKRKD